MAKKIQVGRPIVLMPHAANGTPYGVENNSLNGLGLQGRVQEMSNPYRDGGRPIQVTGLAPFQAPPQQLAYRGGVERNQRVVGGSEYVLRNAVVGDYPETGGLPLAGSMQNLPRQGDSQAALSRGISGGGGMSTSFRWANRRQGRTGLL